MKRKLMITLAFIVFTTVSFSGCANHQGAAEASAVISTPDSGDNLPGWKVYQNKEYHVSFKYPASWTPMAGYLNRLGGNDGWLQIDAAEGTSMDDVTQRDAYHKHMPYGSNPEIKAVEIQGQEARLILPSSDQAKEMLNQAGLIVKYPKAVQINKVTYDYFVLWADKACIERISQTVLFIG